MLLQFLFCVLFCVGVCNVLNCLPLPWKLEVMLTCFWGVIGLWTRNSLLDFTGDLDPDVRLLLLLNIAK